MMVWQSRVHLCKDGSSQFDADGWGLIRQSSPNDSKFQPVPILVDKFRRLVPHDMRKQLLFDSLLQLPYSELSTQQTIDNE